MRVDAKISIWDAQIGSSTYCLSCLQLLCMCHNSCIHHELLSYRWSLRISTCSHANMLPLYICTVHSLMQKMSLTTQAFWPGSCTHTLDMYKCISVACWDSYLKAFNILYTFFPGNNLTLNIPLTTHFSYV